MDEIELKRQLERVHADCFGWAMACCGRDRDDPEEVLQTVYLKVLDGRARYDGRSSYRTWISLMVRIKNTLTPAQQAKLADIRNRRD